MKFIIWTFAAFLSITSLQSQDFAGTWNGILKTSGMQLTLVFNVDQADGVYITTLDSPDQGAEGIPASSTMVQDSLITIELSALGAKYTGRLNSENVIEGTFQQSGQSFPLVLTQEKVEKEEMIRPQEPQPPFQYYTEEVSFTNIDDDVTLAGTLTLPSDEGLFPVVVLISGSGPQDRNEELLGHKPFLFIADYLTRNGFGVLRYDDRGTAQSTGDFGSATSVDFARDVKSGVAYLKTRGDIDTNHIGLIGHSEGGLIAPMVASESTDIAFIVLLAGPGIPGYDILLLQTELITKASGTPDSSLQSDLAALRGALDLVLEHKDDASLIAALETNPEYLIGGLTPDEFVAVFGTPWMRLFLEYDPTAALSKVQCPVLALNGEKDLQVPPAINLDAIESALNQGGNKNTQVMELPGLNHLFQESQTGSPSEYAEIEQTFSQSAISIVLNWLQAQVQ